MTETVPTPEQENKKPASRKLNKIDQKIKHGFQHVHKKIGVYGWVSVGLFLLLLGTIAHYEGRDFRRYHDWSMPRPMYIHKQNDWMRDINCDFENMHRQMDMMRARHERMIRDVWEAPIDPKTTMTSIVSNGDYQYSVNTRDGKFDGFVTTSDTTKAGLLLTQIKGLGLTVDQKDSKLFFNGDAQKLSQLLSLLNNK